MAACADQALILDHMHLVQFAVREFHGVPPCVREDLTGAGMLGLVQAARDYNPALGKFKPYAQRRIWGAVLDELRRANWGSRSIAQRAARAAGVDRDELPGRDQPVMCLDLLDVDGASVDPGPEALVVRADEHRQLRAAVDQLPERQRFVITAAYLQGRLLADISAELGITLSGASWLQRDALGRLHGILAAADPGLPPRRQIGARWLRRRPRH